MWHCLHLPLHSMLGWCSCCCMLGSTHTHPFETALCPGLPRWAGTRKVKPIWNYWSKRQWVTVASAGPYAPCSRQITTPAPHHSVFYRLDAFPAAQPTASKHWRQCTIRQFQCTLGTNQSISPACWDHSSKPTTAVQWVNGTDRQTDRQTQTDTELLHRACSTYNAGSANKGISPIFP